MHRFTKWLGVTILLSLAAYPSPLGGATCGGTERWQVKVGTDTGVGNVDLTTQIPMTVPTMLQLSEPQLPATGDNNTRLSEETHVYMVTGHLVRFKLESGSTGDQDYHMVISDDTLIFTDDSAGQPPGHSLVAEIPNPDCIAGKHGDPSVQSRFIDSIRTSRSGLEGQFPNIDPSGGFNDAGGIAVCVIGAGFFDFPHGQVGRATNNVEIHPVLNISFSPCTTQPAPPNGVQPTPPSPVPTGQTATVNHNVRLHTDPDKTSETLRTLPTGTTLTVLDPTPQNGYLHVRTGDGQEGWV
jgi:hypothetical protein